MEHRAFTSWRKCCCVQRHYEMSYNIMLCQDCHTVRKLRVSKSRYLMLVLANLIQIVLAQYSTLTPLSPSARPLYSKITVVVCIVAVQNLPSVEMKLFGNLQAYYPMKRKRRHASDAS